MNFFSIQKKGVNIMKFDLRYKVICGIYFI